jgi:hypothetical protein
MERLPDIEQHVAASPAARRPPDVIGDRPMMRKRLLTLKGHPERDADRRYARGRWTTPAAAPPR